MPAIPGFWHVGPHAPFLVEDTWNEFVRSNGGRRVADELSKSPNFENADYIFDPPGIVAELKEVITEFGRAHAFQSGYDALMKRLIAENTTWRPMLFGGDEKYPPWFPGEFLRLFRQPIARILKKANRQLRETKEHYGLQGPNGVLILVNDGLTDLSPDLVRSLACDILIHSYTSIDCLVYMTCNRYIEVKGSNVPRLLWAPAYSDKATDSLHQFINDLGRKWRRFLEGKFGPFPDVAVETDSDTIIRGSRAITIPG